MHQPMTLYVRFAFTIVIVEDEGSSRQCQWLAVVPKLEQATYHIISRKGTRPPCQYRLGHASSYTLLLSTIDTLTGDTVLISDASNSLPLYRCLARAVSHARSLQQIVENDPALDATGRRLRCGNL